MNLCHGNSGQGSLKEGIQCMHVPYSWASQYRVTCLSVRVHCPLIKKPAERKVLPCDVDHIRLSANLALLRTTHIFGNCSAGEAEEPIQDSHSAAWFQGSIGAVLLCCRAMASGPTSYRCGYAQSMAERSVSRKEARTAWHPEQPGSRSQLPHTRLCL